MSATQAVIDFILDTSLSDLPPALLAEGRRCVLDGIGVALAGSTDQCSRIVQDQIRVQGGSGEASILGHAQWGVPASLAARANGTAGHAMDFDDTQLSNAPDRIFGLLTHPTVAPLAAGLAVAERENASGAALLEAFLVGFEVECKVSEAIHPRHYREGFHSTATVGTIGAMATAAKLMGLDRDRLAMALGIAASLASGIRLGFGTMTKPLHAGRAAENGIVAADLAAGGFTAGHDALEAEWGFFRVFGGGFEPERIVGALGSPFTLLDPGVSVKPFPSGSLGHPSMQALLDLVTDKDIAPEDIATITFRAGHNILRPLRYAEPTNELEAKFCIPFVLSCIALHRRAGIREFEDDFVHSDEAREMMARVHVEFDGGIDAQGYDRMRSAMDVALRDGSEFTIEADTYPGGPERPLTREQLHAKFRDCGSLVLTDDAIDRAIQRLESVDQLDSVSELIAALTPPGGGS